LVDALELVPLAGQDAIDRSVRWVHVSELLDPAVYLKGGELLLLVGVQLPTQQQALRDYVRRLVQASVAGLGFGTGPVHEHVPPALVDACHEVGLPLVEVPDRVPFIAISEAVAEAALAAETSRLRRLGEGSRALARAAVGPAGIRAVLTRLADNLSGWVVLTDGTGKRRRMVAGPVELSPDVSALVQRLTCGTGATSASLHEQATHIELQSVGGPHTVRSALVVGKPTPFDAADRGIVSVAVGLLTLLTEEPMPSGFGIGSALTLLACGGDLEDAEAAAAAGIEARRGSTWRVFRCQRARYQPGTESEGDLLAETIATLLQTPLVAAQGGQLVALRPERGDLSEVIDTLAVAGWVAGISAARPWSAVPESARASEHLAYGAVISGRSVVADQASTDVQIADLIPPDLARRYARRLFEPLQAIRSPEPTELLLTLRVWLGNHGNWDRTAAQLGIHRNTVRHRIVQLERLLSRDLTRVETRMELWFALGWLINPLERADESRDRVPVSPR
jgi:hypothetical protein